MTVKDIYLSLSDMVPAELSCEWDNDGIMASYDTDREVMSVLVTLDITEEAVKYAIDEGFDLIVSHHPLVFRPLGAVTDESHIAKKAMKLIRYNISAISLHTRLDRVVGGVNDKLAETLGLKRVEPFGYDSLGRIGDLVMPMSCEDFALFVKDALGSDTVRISGDKTVSRVALVGGDGKEYVKAAIDAGADTYLSGRIGYNVMMEASEMGINLVEAGHYFTEQPVTEVLYALLKDLDDDLVVEIFESNLIKCY